jgi:hypothetical protein
VGEEGNKVKTYQIDSDITVHPAFTHGFTERQIKDEPMLFNCDGMAAYELGGPITRAVLDKLPPGWYSTPIVVDTRVHMLMPGWFPCIPGWHHDDVPRTRSDKQPNYDTPEYQAEHILFLANGEICPTQFALGSISVPEVPLGETIYKKWHPLVVDAVEYGDLEFREAPSNRLIGFNWQTWHQGAPAKKGGWRYFFRASRFTDRVNQCTNEIRRQVQVYLEFPMEGW